MSLLESSLRSELRSPPVLSACLDGLNIIVFHARVKNPERPRLEAWYMTYAWKHSLFGAVRADDERSHSILLCINGFVWTARRFTHK